MIRLQERRIERNKRFFKNQRVSVVRKGEPFRGPFRPRPVTKAFSRRANHQFTLVVLIVLNGFYVKEGGTMGFLYLLGAIISEVFGSSMLKLTATTQNKFAIIGVVSGYFVSFYLLSLALLSVPLSVGYAIWGGVGTALTALVGVIFYREKINRQTII